MVIPLPPPAPDDRKTTWLDSFCYRHCENCFMSSCGSADCPVSVCPLNCGTRMHKCKLSDHITHVCAFSIVPCINQELGCPKTFKRCKQGQHLSNCPASIVHCTAEWNRWPRFLGEKYPSLLPPSSANDFHDLSLNAVTTVSLKSVNVPFTSVYRQQTVFSTHQFDLALTSRDQSVLEESTSVSSQTKGALCSPLTRLYPALPMTSPLYHGAFKVTCDGSKFPLIASPFVIVPVSPSGLPIPLLLHQPKQLWLESVDEIFPSTTHCLHSKCAQSIEINFSEKKDCIFSRSLPCQFHDLFQKAAGDQTMPDNDQPANTCIRPTSLSETMSWAINDRSLQVDCRLEFVPRYVQKPRAMYTFLCDLDIPRRSFGHHYRLHCDALAQVDYWLEQRCPLAYLGCTFSAVRLRPNCPDCRLVYMPEFSGFSARYSATPSEEDFEPSPQNSLSTRALSSSSKLLRETKGLSTIPASPEYSSSDVDSGISPSSSTRSRVRCYLRLDELPEEVLLHISRYLDEISLILLSKLSERMADFCTSLLPVRGIVTPIWRRVHESTGLITWKIANFVWTFPFQGESICQWHIADKAVAAKITSHLSVCPFYEAVRSETPFNLLYCPKSLPFT